MTLLVPRWVVTENRVKSMVLWMHLFTWFYRLMKTLGTCKVQPQKRLSQSRNYGDGASSKTCYGLWPIS